MSLSPYDSGRTYYEAIHLSKDSIKSTYEYILRLLIINLSVSIGLILFMQIEGKGILEIFSIITFCFSETLYDEAQRYLVTIKGPDSYKDLLKKKAIFITASFIVIVILIYQGFIQAILFLSIIFFSLCNFLSVYFNKSSSSIFSLETILKSLKYFHIKKIRKIMNIGGPSGGLMMYLETTILNLTFVVQKFILYGFFEDLQYLFSLCFSACNAINSIFVFEYLSKIRIHFADPNKFKNSLPKIKTKNIILFFMISIFLALFFAITFSFLRIYPSGKFDYDEILIIFLSILNLTLSFSCKDLINSWLHYKKRGLKLFLIYILSFAFSLIPLIFIFYRNSSIFDLNNIVFSSLVFSFETLIIYFSYLLISKNKYFLDFLDPILRLF